MNDLAVKKIRKRILEMSFRAKSAHAGSALSCVEILYALFLARQQNQGFRKIILSKGHAAMALYAVLEHFGIVRPEELEKYLQDGTQLWGHPSCGIPREGIDWSTGSLGHGFPVTVGFAYASKYLQGTGQTVAAVLSDGECNEGTIWEAALLAGHHRLSNCVAIVDYNKIQSFGRCEEVLQLEPFADKWRAFGWQVAECDGHDLTALGEILGKAGKGEKPLLVLAHTLKGKGVPEIEDTVASHYRPITEAQWKGYPDA